MDIAPWSSSSSPQSASDPSSSSIPSPLPPTCLQLPSPPITKSIANTKWKPGLLINTHLSRGELPLLRILIEKNGWKEVYSDGDILWSGLALPEEEFFFSEGTKANRIPGMKDLAHKKTTGFFLNKFREYFKEEYDFFPRTFLYPEEIETFEDYMKKKGGVYIVKPTSGSQGDGIYIINKFGQLRDRYFNKGEEMVIQEYIDNPLLVGGKKFDIRLYVAIVSVEPLITMICSEGLARFATEDYQKVSKENLKEVYRHLTNYSLNKMSQNYVYTEELYEINNASKRTLTSLWKELSIMGYDVEEILKRIDELVKKFMKSMQFFMLYNYKAAYGNNPHGECFHVLGFDILLDENLKPWILEINNNPSLNIYHEDENNPDKKLKKNISKISPLDLHVKSMVVEDTLKIMSMSNEKKISIAKEGCFNSFRKILIEDNVENEKDIFGTIVEIFGKLGGYKFKSTINASRFKKLAGLAGMTNQAFTKNDYDLLWTKMLRNNYDNKNMDFYDFIRTYEELAKRLIPEFSVQDKFPAVYKLTAMIKNQINNLT